MKSVANEFPLTTQAEIFKTMIAWLDAHLK